MNAKTTYFLVLHTQKSGTTHGKRGHYCNTACKFLSSNLLNIIAVTRRESRLKVGGAAEPGFLDRWSQLGRNRHNLPRIGDEAASENRLAAAKNIKVQKCTNYKYAKLQKFKNTKI